MTYSHIEPLEARIAPASLSIADAQFTEGDAGKTSVSFTITLSAADTKVVRVDYRTADGTATATGAFSDYGAQDRTLAFLPGETTKTISLPIIGDVFREADETFTVTLSNPVNATIADPTATGRILNGADTILGLALVDTKVTEGTPTDPAVVTETKAVSVRAVLSDNTPTAITFTLTTQTGTAVTGSDFTDGTKTGTIAANTKTGSVSFDVTSDRNFEATEFFFANLATAPTGVQVVNSNPVNPAVAATARVYIFNDDTQVLSLNKAQWIDVDGDLVTITVSKGRVDLTNLFTFAPQGSVGGQQLQLLDLSRFGTTFSGANVSIIATKQPGFPDPTDGRVDVGFIKGTTFDPDELRAVGVDLALVTIDGDLGRITAGDSLSTPAINRLEVFSLGARGLTTQPPNDPAQPANDASIESKVLGPIGSIFVHDDVNGFLHVIGSEFGVIGSLRIDGSLQGLGTSAASGAISVSGRLGTAKIGNIIGGGGVNSGLLGAPALGNSSIGSVTVTGSIIGGAGNDSGQISAPRIGSVIADEIIGGTGLRSGTVISNSTLGSVTLAGDLVGGTNTDAGEIFAQTGLGSVKVGGDVVGGAGQNGGSIRTGGGILSLNVAGDVQGGAGSGSGAIVASGNIDRLVIGKSLLGGNSTTTTFLDKTGFISALRLKSVTIGEDIVSGKNLGGGLANSGAIRADVIDVLTVRGDVTGNNTAGKLNPVIISAGGQTGNLAIGNLSILGNAALAEILAGYNDVTSATNFRGTGVSADASIGTVLVGQTIHEVNIVAGAQPGTGGLFGDANDALLAVSRNSPTIFSQIASVTLKGTIIPNSTAYGIVAQSIGSIKVGPAGTPVALQPGAGNDIASSATDLDPGILIRAGTNFRALELHL